MRNPKNRRFGADRISKVSELEFLPTAGARPSAEGRLLEEASKPTPDTEFSSVITGKDGEDLEPGKRPQ